MYESSHYLAGESERGWQRLWVPTEYESKVDMEKVPTGLQHNVVEMPIDMVLDDDVFNP
jgi:hypothetical protein